MEIEYQITKSRRRSISVTISNEGKVLVKAPLSVSNKAVEEFLYSKKNWILNRVQKVIAENQAAQQMGLITPEQMEQIKKKARKVIEARVEYYAKLGGISYNKIFIRLQSTRWGSCSAEGNLNFNCLLVLMPLEVLDSVVVHELCHRKQMNHSKAFYTEVYKLFPEYNKWDKWLKQNGGVYLKRIM